MPRNVRNFWVEAEVDGRKTPIKFGPQGKGGGFSLTVFMRNQGEVERVADIMGGQYAEQEDILCLHIRCDGDSISTQRER